MISNGRLIWLIHTLLWFSDFCITSSFAAEYPITCTLKLINNRNPQKSPVILVIIGLFATSPSKEDLNTHLAFLLDLRQQKTSITADSSKRLIYYSSLSLAGEARQKWMRIQRNHQRVIHKQAQWILQGPVSTNCFYNLIIRKIMLSTYGGGGCHQLWVRRNAVEHSLLNWPWHQTGCHRTLMLCVLYCLWLETLQSVYIWNNSLYSCLLGQCSCHWSCRYTGG